MIFENLKLYLFRSKTIFVHPMPIKLIMKISQEGGTETTALKKQMLSYFVNYVLVACF